MGPKGEVGGRWTEVPAEWPAGLEVRLRGLGSSQGDTFTVDHWRCRFISESGDGGMVAPAQVISLLVRLNAAGLDVIKTENLYNFDGVKGFSA